MGTLQTTLMLLALGGPTQGETVLLDFTAPWCKPCRQMNPVVNELEAKGYPVRRVDFDRERALADRYGVDQIPEGIAMSSATPMLNRLFIAARHILLPARNTSFRDSAHTHRPVSGTCTCAGRSPGRSRMDHMLSDREPPPPGPSAWI